MSKRFRFLCPQCCAYQEVKGNGPCWKCHVEVALPTDGLILIYRKSSVPAMMEILLNGYDLGCLWINECVQIPVQYGHYNVVVKYLDKVMTKYKGIGMEFDITPDNRIMYLKVERVIPGYTATVVVEQATPEEMPPLQ
jgi:hypothetical protein